jgi:hypothetical protein
MKTFAATASRDLRAPPKRYIPCTDAERLMNYLNKRKVRGVSDLEVIDSELRLLLAIRRM